MIENYISPANLYGLVANTAPFLIPRIEAASPAPGDHPFAYLDVLRGVDRVESTGDYFAFCVACHHATVATYVPTDVDSKIRGLLWREERSSDARRRMFEFTLRAMRWSIEGVSARETSAVSGHNGEMLSVLAGALGAFLKSGDEEYAASAAEAIDAELHREAGQFQLARKARGRELDVLRLAASLTHNVGDLDQGVSFWPQGGKHSAARARFGRLAHENPGAEYAGAFQDAARIYRKAMSPEGHRNYPLRAVKALRRSPDLLLPLGPFLDDWGAATATHTLLNAGDRAQTLAALLEGCRKIPGQRGYFRAIHGMAEALGGRIEEVVRLLPSAARATWKDAAVRKQVAIPRPSFESMMRKMATA